MFPNAVSILSLLKSVLKKKIKRNTRKRKNIPKNTAIVFMSTKNLMKPAKKKFQQTFSIRNVH